MCERTVQASLFRLFVIGLVLFTPIVAASAGQFPRYARPGNSHAQQARPLSHTEQPSITPASAPRLDNIGLHVETKGSVRGIALNYGQYAFGLALSLDKPSVEQTFVLRNNSMLPLEKLRLRFSDPACLSAILVQKNGRGLASRPLAPDLSLPVLPPRTEVAIRVTLDLTRGPAGSILERVLVMKSDRPHPVALLELSGEQVPLIAFAPASVDFGTLTAGKSSSQMVTVKIHPRLVPTGSVPKVICSNPDVRVEAVPLDPAAKRTSPMLNASQKTAGLFTFRLTLPANASVGAVSGSLSVAYLAPPLHPEKTVLSPLLPSVVTGALHSMVAFVRGRVEGDVSAAPSGISFGTVGQGQEASQEITLTVKDDHTLDRVLINTPTPWLTARLAMPTGSAPVGLVVGVRGVRQNPMLEVLLSPQAPAGRFVSQLTLTLANGQRLTLPVTALITAKATPSRKSEKVQGAGSIKLPAVNK